MLKKKDVGKYETWIKNEYYLEKTPLYLRNGKVNAYKNLYGFLQTIYDVMCNLEETPYQILNGNFYKKDNKNNLYQLTLSKNTPEQIKLKYYWDKLHKENNQITPQLIYHNYYYYQSLVKDLKLVLSRPLKKNWKNLINLYGIKYKLKFTYENDLLKLNLSNDLDELTKIIFRDIFEIKNLEIKSLENMYDTKDKRIAQFNNAIFDNSYFYETVETFEDNDIYE